MGVRARIESGIAAWARGIAQHHPVLAVLACLVATLSLGVLVPQMRVDTATESFLHPDSPSREVYDEFRRRFGRDDTAIIVIGPPEIFELAFLERLRGFHEAIESEVPYVDEVTSLLNVRVTRGEGDELIVEELFEEWPRTLDDLDAIRARALANPLYRNAVLSANARWTAVSIRPLSDSSEDVGDDLLAGFEDAAASPDAALEASRLSDHKIIAFVNALERLVEEHSSPVFPLQLAGPPISQARIDVELARDVERSGAICAAAIALLLYVIFRRVSGVLIPLGVVGCALVSTQGAQVLLDIPLSIPLQVLPSLLLAVGVCGTVHLLVIFYQGIDEGLERSEAIFGAFEHSGMAVLLASFTTALGFMSFGFAEIAPIAQLGLIAPLGVGFCFAYTMLLLPALLALLPIRRAETGHSSPKSAPPARAILALTDFGARRPRLVLTGGATVLAVAVVGMTQLRFGQDALTWLPDEDPLRLATELADREFGGVATLEVVVEADRDRAFHEPENLVRLERAMERAESLSLGTVYVGKATSIVDVIKEIHQALHAGMPEMRILPPDRRAVAQELLLFESSGSDDLADVTDSRYRVARMAMRTPWRDAVEYPPFVAHVDRELASILGPDLSFRITGTMALLSESVTALVVSMARSYVFALLVITPTMVLLIGSLRTGLVSMIPNLLPVSLTLGLMGWVGISLDGSTLLLGSILLGLAVDDTIHFMHRFQGYYGQSGRVRLSIRRTAETTGVAMLTTSVVLSLGFLSFMAAYLLNAVQFGMLAAFGAVIALLSDVLIAPALLVLVVREHPGRGADATHSQGDRPNSLPAAPALDG